MCHNFKWKKQNTIYNTIMKITNEHLDEECAPECQRSKEPLKNKYFTLQKKKPELSSLIICFLTFLCWIVSTESMFHVL